uniref:Uncharacterized protein n=1 Tax=Phlebotomus papatasi TaxID=29031 RepID=A0A1B0DML4_PHLPP
MEVMEEGNLMDRVPILLQRDMQYYQQNQVVLQETICPGIVGGKLDFPRYASFAAVKIVRWWEDEYYAAYKKNSGLLNLFDIKDEIHEESEDDLGAHCGGIVKTSDPEKFVNLLTKCADKLLEHIHHLSQEALDHADLTVLTATIGAAALVKNSIWIYLQNVSVSVCPPRGDEKGGSLKMSYKQYSELTEALAERLLDLHCRLLTLYILQDAETLNWENQQPFFESERGSYTVQMWWLYMQGTRKDLWNSVPPNMAQRVFAGMLNETLTVFTIRYTQLSPSQARSQLLLVDICNILHCVAELLPAISENAEAYVGLNIINQTKTIRDIHAKCQELFSCLLLRGAPLGVLFRVLKKGPASMGMMTSRQGLPAPWIIFTLPKMFPTNQNGHWATRCSEFGPNTALSLELRVLMGAPQANWSLLLKVLLMRDANLSMIILHHLLSNQPSSDRFVAALAQPLLNRKKFAKKCEGFMCGMECTKVEEWTKEDVDPVGQTNYQVVLSLVYVVVMTGKMHDINLTLISALEKTQVKDWAAALDRRQVWNQKRPAWLEALLHLVYPVLDPVVHMLISAVHTGNASMYQAMSLAISCFSEMWDCIPDCLYKVSIALMDIIPADVRPLGDSVLIQILFMALYTKLLEVCENESDKDSEKASICQTVAEAICSVDADNKHTDQLSLFLKQARDTQLAPTTVETAMEETVGLSFTSTVKIDDLEAGMQPSTSSGEEFDVENADYIAEMLASDVLTTPVGKQSLRILFRYIKNNLEWIYQQLGVSEVEKSELQPLPGQKIEEDSQTLLHIMFHIGQQPFDQLLTGGLRIDYGSWLQTPMSMNVERAWLQISQRFEFKEGSKLSLHDTTMVAFITSQLKQAN